MAALQRAMSHWGKRFHTDKPSTAVEDREPCRAKGPQDISPLQLSESEVTGKGGHEGHILVNVLTKKLAESSGECP